MKKIYKINGLDCANCAAKVERAIGKLDGVNSASVNFFMQKITVDLDDARAAEIEGDIKKVCRKVEPEMKFHD